MTRAKLRSMIRDLKHVGLASLEMTSDREEVLNGCANPRTRAILRRRLLTK